MPVGADAFPLFTVRPRWDIIQAELGAAREDVESGGDDAFTPLSEQCPVQRLIRTDLVTAGTRLVSVCTDLVTAGARLVTENPRSHTVMADLGRSGPNGV